MSRRSQAASIGAGFEAVISDCLQLAANRRELAWNRVGTQARAKRDRSGSLYFAPGISMPDFIGCFRGGGMFMFDAKTVAAKSWHLQASSAHQFETLRRYAEAGALAGFLVQQTDDLRRSLQVCFLRVLPITTTFRLPVFHFPSDAVVPVGGNPLAVLPLPYPLAVHRCSLDLERPDYFLQVMGAWAHR